MTTPHRAQLEALREGAGAWVERRAALRVRGRDARDYLHRMTSQDLARLEPHGFTRTLVLTPQGRMVGAPWVWALEDGFLLDLEPETLEPVRTRLERTVITEEVTFEAAETKAAFVVGPGAGQLLRFAGAAAPSASPEAGTWWRYGDEAGGLRVARTQVGEGGAFRALGAASGTFPLGFPLVLAPEVFDAQRVLDRHPAWGRELTGDILPLEARLETNAISFVKGCYPGQEPVTMARHRGHPPTLLVRVRREGEAGAEAPRPGAEGAALLHEGRKVGRLATTTDLTDAAEPNALAFVRHALAGEAPTLAIEGGGVAHVLEGEGP